MSWQTIMEQRMQNLEDSFSSLNSDSKSVNDLTEKSTYETGMYVPIYDPTQPGEEKLVKFPWSSQIQDLSTYVTDAELAAFNYADQAYVNNAVAALVDSSPAALDTLNELAAALGDDPNFATTVTNSLAGKANLSGGNSFAGDQVITGNVNATSFTGDGVNVTNVDAVSLNGYSQSTSGSANRIPLIDSGGDLYVIRDYYTRASGSWSKVLSIASLDSNLPSNVARKDSDNNFSAQTFTGNINATGQNITAAAFIGDGSQVDNVDAETLDGFDSSDFVRLTGSVTQTVTGEKTFSSKALFSAQIAQGTSSATNTRSVAFGYNTTSSGLSSISMHDQTTASGDSSLAGGRNTIASGVGSVAFGFTTFARADEEFSIGRYGTDYTPTDTDTDRLFNIGNGSSGSTSDAFTVLRNGNGTLSGTFKAGGYQSSDGSTGVTQTWSVAEGDTVTVKNGIITNITTI